MAVVYILFRKNKYNEMAVGAKDVLTDEVKTVDKPNS